MPIFEYTCSDCGKEFKKLVLSSAGENEIRCPDCNSKNIKKEISLFSAKTTGESYSSASCAPSAST